MTAPVGVVAPVAQDTVAVKRAGQSRLGRWPIHLTIIVLLGRSG